MAVIGDNRDCRRDDEVFMTEELGDADVHAGIDHLRTG